MLQWYKYLDFLTEWFRFNKEIDYQFFRDYCNNTLEKYKTLEKEKFIDLEQELKAQWLGGQELKARWLAGKAVVG